MFKLQELSEAFKTQYEKFINACDALEDKGDWDVQADGEMEAYYLNDMMCAILMLISADGEFEEEEAKYINDIFGFRYTVDELKEIYRTNGGDIRNMLENEIPAGYRRMKSINSALAEHYRNLILHICGIMAESDGIIEVEEVQETEKIKKALQD